MTKSIIDYEQEFIELISEKGTIGCYRKNSMIGEQLAGFLGANFMGFNICFIEDPSDDLLRRIVFEKELKKKLSQEYTACSLSFPEFFSIFSAEDLFMSVRPCLDNLSQRMKWNLARYLPHTNRFLMKFLDIIELPTVQVTLSGVTLMNNFMGPDMTYTLINKQHSITYH